MIAGLELEATIIIGLVVALAFWKRHPVLYIVACPLTVAYALTIYDIFQSPSGMVLTIVVTGVGGFLFYCFLMHVMGKWE